MKSAKKPFFAYRSFWKEFDAMKRFAQIGVKQFVVRHGQVCLEDAEFENAGPAKLP